MNWRKDKKKKKRSMTAGSNTRPRGWESDVCSTRPQPYSLGTSSGARSLCHAFFFLLSFLQFILFVFFYLFCFVLFTITTVRLYAKLFPLYDTQPNRTNFRFSNSRTLVNQLVDHWSCAMASFWDFKIICAPSIISKTVQWTDKIKNAVVRS